VINNSNNMPTLDFFGTQITSMIIGDNPVNGHSYIQDRISGEEMSSFYTEDRFVDMLFECEAAGFNTFLPLACEKDFSALRKFYANGGKMNLIFQPFPPTPLEINVKEMMEFAPIGIYHQGTTTDYLTETDQIDLLRHNIELIRESGAAVGLCSHVPETLLMSENENWGIDFYMACLYNARRDRRGVESGFITGKTKANLLFYPDDRFLMYDAIQKIKKPVIAYKILAGGQIFENHIPSEYREIAKRFIKEAYDNIKPIDATCVGVFQRDFDQIEQNREMLLEIFSV